MWNNTTRAKLQPKTERNKTENRATTQRPRTSTDFILPGGLGGWTEYGADIGEITYFTVLRVLSEAVGKLPIHVRDKNHNIVYGDAERILTVAPCAGRTPVSVFSYLEYCRNHYGNGYAYVKWNDNTGRLESMTPLNPSQVRLWVDDVNDDILTKHYYSYTTPTGNSYFLPSEDVVHVKCWHLDDPTRLIGLPVRETLREYMTAAKAGQETQTNLYRNGLISSGVLNYVGDLSDADKQQMLENIKKIGTKNKIIPLPKDWELKTLNLSLADTQYLETRKFTAQQIASAFGVNPTQLNDYSKGSYANATAQELQFLTSTLLYISRQYEDTLTQRLLTEAEINAGIRVDVDTDAVLKTTPEVLATVLNTYVKGSIMSINEARDRAGLPPREGGDQLMTMPGAGTVQE